VKPKLDEIQRKRIEVEDALVGLLLREQEIEEKIDKIEEREEATKSYSEKRLVEKERWQREKERKEIETKKWYWEAEKVKIKASLTEINSEYQGLMKERKEAEKKIEEINTTLRRSPRSNERIRIAVKTSDAEMSIAREEEKERMEEKKKQEVLKRVWAEREKVSKKGLEEKEFSSEERERKKFLQRIDSGEITNKVSSLPYQQIPVEENFTPQPIPKKQSELKKLLTRFFIFLIAFFLIAGLIFSLVRYFILKKR
jgi:hypothetical protein